MRRYVSSLKPETPPLNELLVNRFNYFDVFVVPAQGQSGGLWLIWNDESMMKTQLF
jgi:hypothetical protein